MIDQDKARVLLEQIARHQAVTEKAIKLLLCTVTAAFITLVAFSAATYLGLAR